MPIDSEYMRPAFFRYAALAILGLTSSTVGASEFRCPQTILESPSVSARDRQWLVVARQGERALEGVGIFLGTPAEFGAQVPDASKVERNRELVTWRILRATGDRFWVGCVYSGTTAMLFQKLAADESLCVATYDLLPSGKRQRLSSMQCH